MDFYRISLREIESGPKKGTFELYPDFIVGRSKDLMVQGKSFFAIWDEDKGLWSTDEYDVQRLVDESLDEYAKKCDPSGPLTIKHLRSFSSNGWSQFRKFVQNVSDNSHLLDSNLTFANTVVKKSDYASKRLPYSLEEGDYSAWDELVGTLYNVDERAKIEWALGAIVAGDAKTIQKFLVFYGPPGSGKGTIMTIAEKLFEGYTTTFDAKALGSSNGTFSTESFAGNPLVAIQHDGDLSGIQDNTKLNSVVSHEIMSMNAKFKPIHSSRVCAFCLMGTNKPVKISDAKSGIIRRLIDVHPTGVLIPKPHYDALMAKAEFELGAIAYHCLQVYRSMGKNYYGSYKPLEMMLQTDVFYNFIEAYWEIFREQDSVTLQQGYTLYQEYCNNTGIEKLMPQYKFRGEFRNYFDEFKDRGVVNGKEVRSLYVGFNANRYKMTTKGEVGFTLVMEETESLLDQEYANMPAQGAGNTELPRLPWKKVTTSLSDIDTSLLHYVKIPENHIVIDFDLKDENGEKSLEANLAAASVWPSTYAELSKSGSGVHLHYIYEGDVYELAAVYSEGIEVKTLLGDASLRRRLSRCNNIPIATFNGVLPIKEKKVLQNRTIQSERGLRDLIARAMNKEFNSGTKSSVDFIHKILDDAYDSGMQYNVTDLRAKILAFANNSSNQPIQALKTVQLMKFQCKDAPEERLLEPGMNDTPSEAVEKNLLAMQHAGNPFVKKDDREVFFDLEVYPNLVVVCWKYAGEDSTIVKMINPSAQDVEMLFSLRLIGFNNRRYDNHILYAIYMGYGVEEVYKLSQNIIANNQNAMFGKAYELSYTDIYDYSSLKQSLKKFMIDLGIHKMEMDIPWDQPVPKEKVLAVVEYCCNDVLGTEATHIARKQDWNARLILTELSGLTPNHTTQQHTARIIFNGDRAPQRSFIYTDLTQEFPGYTFDMGKSKYKGYDVGEGGFVYAEPGMYENVVELDIESMHPTTIEVLNVFGDYTPNFSDLKSARLAIKHKNYDEAKKMLGGKLEPFLNDPAEAKALSYALKIVINIVYGLTAAKFDNAFRDPRNKDNIVAKRGALFMVDLKDHVENKMGLRVIHIKTDSIKVANPTDAQMAEIHEFGANYGYTFEHEATYAKFCLVNDAVYIAKYGWHKDDATESNPEKIKAGTWYAVGAQFQHPYVFKQLFSKEELAFDDYCETKQVLKGAMYMDPEPAREDVPKKMEDGKLHFIGRIGRFIPVEEGSGGSVLYRVVDGKHYAVAGTKGHYWVEANVVQAIGIGNYQVDVEFFEKLCDKARKDIEKYGSFEEFVA